MLCTTSRLQDGKGTGLQECGCPYGSTSRILKDDFRRFVIPLATTNVESVLWCLRLAFAMYRKPYAFYRDRGRHFLITAYYRTSYGLEGLNITYSPSGSSKSTGMVEMSNRLIEDVLRKHPQNSHLEWDQRPSKSARAVNSRVIDYHIVALKFFESPMHTYICAIRSPLISALKKGVVSYSLIRGLLAQMSQIPHQKVHYVHSTAFTNIASTLVKPIRHRFNCHITASLPSQDGQSQEAWKQGLILGFLTEGMITISWS